MSLIMAPESNSPSVETAAPTPSPEGKRTTYLLPDGTVDTSVLQDRTPRQLKLSRGATVLIAVLGLLFTFFSFLPLWHTDLWGHLSYGRWIVEHGVPTTEPLMPLDAGVPFNDLAWLSQVVGYFIYSQYGVPGIQFASACCITAVLALFAGAVYNRTGNVFAALATTALLLVVDSQQFFFGLMMIPRPQLAAMVCFAMTFVLGTSLSRKWWHLLAIFVTFALWGNLHGSFVVGIVTLCALTVGRYIDFSWRAKNPGAGWSDPQFRHLLLATELATAAVLLSPYGIGVYGEALSVAGNANVRDLVEWEPLTLRMLQGKFAAAAALLLVVLYRFSPRRVSASEMLLLVGLGVLAMWTSRMIVWWAPVVAYYIGLHLAAATKCWFNPSRYQPVRAGLNTVVALGLCWIYFAYSPLGVILIHGRSDSPEEAAARFRKTVSPQTPVELTNWLNENEIPPGQVFNCSEWGDYLLWAGPEDIQLFVSSHVHLTPEEVWTDYRQISWGLTGDWKNKLDRYGVNTVIMDKMVHSDMIDGMRGLDDWERAYEDRLGAVFVRRKPI
ncbi:MAG: hypothetical protein KDA66_05025 [Planctomycetaceae bacterium]|nr:hypothetical protein [Planctomycetaceae bacterium]